MREIKITCRFYFRNYIDAQTYIIIFCIATVSPFNCALVNKYYKIEFSYISVVHEMLTLLCFLI